MTPADRIRWLRRILTMVSWGAGIGMVLCGLWAALSGHVAVGVPLILAGVVVVGLGGYGFLGVTLWYGVWIEARPSEWKSQREERAEQEEVARKTSA